MATDITTITQLINDFKSETREEAVTVSVLGSLLQKIADAIGNATTEDDLTDLRRLLGILTITDKLLVDVKVGSPDRNQVSLNTTAYITQNGKLYDYQNTVVIRQATTDRAGAMRAQQVIDLNKCKSDINSINSLINDIYESIGRCENDLTNITAQLRKNNDKIGSQDIKNKQIDSSIESLNNRLLKLRAYINEIAFIKQTNIIHIECQIIDKVLFIQGANKLINSGLVPVIFRYSRRSSRYGENDNGERFYMPRRRGWHRFYDTEKLLIHDDDSISFRDESNGNNDNILYDQKPRVLFRKEKIEKDEGKVIAVKIPFGQNLYDIFNKKRYFKFAIGFYKPMSDNKTFQFSELRTNLAVFRVQAEASTNSNGIHSDYYLSR